MNDYLTVKEAAEILREHPVTTSKKCKDGVIPATKTGKCWRISRIELDAFLSPSNSQSADTTPTTPEQVFLTAAQRCKARR